MKITKRQLKQIIREELEATLAENLEQAKKRVKRYCPGPQCKKWKDALDRLKKTQRETIDRSLAEQATEGTLKGTRVTKRQRTGKYVIVTVCTTDEKPICAEGKARSNEAATSRARQALLAKLKGQK